MVSHQWLYQWLIYARWPLYYVMSDRPRDDASRFTEEFSDDDFLEAVANNDPPTTGKIADIVGCSQPTAYQRLDALCENGEVVKRKVGNANVWRLPD